VSSGTAADNEEGGNDMATKINRYQVTLYDRRFNVLAIISFIAEDAAAAHNRAIEISWQHKAPEYRLVEV